MLVGVQLGFSYAMNISWAMYDLIISEVRVILDC